MGGNDGLRDLLIFIMVHDKDIDPYFTGAMSQYINDLAIKAGFTDWIDAYHHL